MTDFKSKFEIDFNLVDHSFCEYNIYGKPPEYFNSYSSLILSCIGLFGLLNYKGIYYVHNIYGALIMNGLTSFLYHYTNKIGWGLISKSG